MLHPARLIRCGFFAALAVTLSFPSLAAPAPVAPRSRAAILKLEQGWIKASMCGDVSFIKNLLANDYRDLSYASVAATPQVSGKAESIRNARNTAAKAGCAKGGPHQEGVHVRIDGRTAVATGTGVVPPHGEHAQGRFHFLDVYAWRDGHWRAVFSEDIDIR